MPKYLKEIMNIMRKETEEMKMNKKQVFELKKYIILNEKLTR